MAQRKKDKPNPTKASESMVARMLAKLFNVPPRESVEQVCELRLENYIDCTLWVREIVGLYHWSVDVSSEVMANEDSALLEHLISSPGQMFVVRDTVRPAEHSLWVAVANPSEALWDSLKESSMRGLFKSKRVSRGRFANVIALQLSSCQLLKNQN